MVDNLSLLISHGLLLITAWRLLARPDLDDERQPSEAKRPWVGLRGSDADA